LKRGSSTIEDGIIYLFPDYLGPKHKKFHKESMIVLFLCLLYHLMKAHVGIPKDSKVIPALYTEGAREEKMESCFFFALGHKGHL
jgi:hypothetical protein